MKLVSWNVNGIRACVKKGAFEDYLKQHEPDVLCVQETKARVEDVDDKIVHPFGYHGAWHSAEKKGYSGVAMFFRQKPVNIVEGFGNPKFDAEGRVISAEFDTFILLNVYFPNGQKNDERLQYKLDFYDAFFAYCDDLRQQGKRLIICGDYNTAHKEIDLARPKENKNTSGFMPIEREWMDRIVDRGYIDTFRRFCSDAEEYSWWNVRTRARERNVGWRIDYFFASDDLKTQLSNAYIQQDVFGSDHCPVVLELAT